MTLQNINTTAFAQTFSLIITILKSQVISNREPPNTRTSLPLWHQLRGFLPHSKVASLPLIAGGKGSADIGRRARLWRLCRARRTRSQRTKHISRVSRTKNQYWYNDTNDWTSENVEEIQTCASLISIGLPAATGSGDTFDNTATENIAQVKHAVWNSSCKRSRSLRNVNSATKSIRNSDAEAQSWTGSTAGNEKATNLGPRLTDRLIWSRF